MVKTGDSDTGVEQLWADYRATREEELRNRLVLQYAPLVKYVAGRVRSGLPSSVEQADLISDGIIGLMDAIDRFEPDRGLQFQTFAVPRIRGAIIDGLRALDWVPRSVRNKVRDVDRAQAVLEARLGRTPEDSEVAAEMGISIRELRDLYAKVSFTSLASFEEFGLTDELAPASLEAVEDTQTRASLMRAVEQLPERDRIIIALYYFEGLTLAEIGEILGVTESRVSQLHTKATLSLRGKLVAMDAA
jgi:RNA polymerase sigma factor for flagellar operon FliA